MNKNPNPHYLTYMVCLSAALAGLLFGIDMGVISGALPLIKETFHLNTHQQEWIVSSILIGAIMGALVSGLISRKFGRKRTILVSAIIFCIGAILSALSPSSQMLILFRIILGFAMGIASFTAPLYLAEVAPRNIRGQLIALYQLMITIGILLAFISDTLLDNWRWMLGITAIPAIVMWLSVMLLPKSPRWLMMTGQKAQAHKTLKKLRTAHAYQIEIEEIQSSLKQRYPIRSLLKNRYFVKVLLLGLSLQFIQQVTGMNTLMYYAPEVFKAAGFHSHTGQMWATIIIGLVNVLTTILALNVIDRFGRRPVLFFGLSIMGISMLLLGILYFNGFHNMLEQYVAIAVVLCFIFGFAISLGPIIWILCSEIFPLQGRDFGITCTTAMNWAANTLVGMTFLTLLDKLGTSQTFWLYGSICLVSLIYLFFVAPETKGVSLETIEKNLFSGKSYRKLGQKAYAPDA